MTVTELSELLLFFLYGQANKEGHTQIFSLNPYAHQLGIDDIGRIYNSTEILKNRGLIKNVCHHVGGMVRASISGEGCLFIENGGQTGIIQKYRSNPQAYTVNINQNTVIHGNVSNSNIAAHSSYVSQKVLSNDIQNILSEIIDALRRDSSLSNSEREDLLHDVETLRGQLSKNKKDRSLIERVLSNLSGVASIGSFITNLYPHIKPLLENI